MVLVLSKVYSLHFASQSEEPCGAKSKSGGGSSGKSWGPLWGSDLVLDATERPNPDSRGEAPRGSLPLAKQKGQVKQQPNPSPHDLRFLLLLDIRYRSRPRQ